MGATQSNRKLTIPNLMDDGVVHISDDLAHRLIRFSELSSDLNDAAAARAPVNAPPSPATGDLPPYNVFYYPGFTISALEMQKQKDIEIMKLEKYWMNRLKHSLISNESLNRTFEEEYEKNLREYGPDNSDQEQSESVAKIQPCLEKTEKLLQCYREQSTEILKCSDIVREFSDCVDQCRANVITAH